MSHVMIDLETLGTGSYAAILSIGAVVFDPDTQSLGREFYAVVDPQSCVDHGLRIDVSTVMWWMKQGDVARAALTVKGVPLPAALNGLAQWMPEAPEVWGNGATFDNVILSNAYKAIGVAQPWKYYNDRCYRTLKNLFPNVPMPTFDGIAHRAIDDAKMQARHANLILLHASLAGAWKGAVGVGRDSPQVATSGG